MKTNERFQHICNISSHSITQQNQYWTQWFLFKAQCAGDSATNTYPYVCIWKFLRALINKQIKQNEKVKTHKQSQKQMETNSQGSKAEKLNWKRQENTKCHMQFTTCRMQIYSLTFIGFCLHFAMEILGNYIYCPIERERERG